MKPISVDIDKIIRKIFNQQHPLLAEIIISWPKIVGSRFSRQTSPLKIITSKERGIKINILHVQAENSGLSLELSFQQEIILERISIYLGFRAINKLRLITQ